MSSVLFNLLQLYFFNGKISCVDATFVNTKFGFIPSILIMFFEKLPISLNKQML